MTQHRHHWQEQAHLAGKVIGQHLYGWHSSHASRVIPGEGRDLTGHERQLEEEIGNKVVDVGNGNTTLREVMTHVVQRESEGRNLVGGGVGVFGPAQITVANAVEQARKHGLLGDPKKHTPGDYHNPHELIQAAKLNPKLNNLLGMLELDDKLQYAEKQKLGDENTLSVALAYYNRGIGGMEHYVKTHGLPKNDTESIKQWAHGLNHETRNYVTNIMHSLEYLPPERIDPPLTFAQMQAQHRRR